MEIDAVAGGKEPTLGPPPGQCTRRWVSADHGDGTRRLPRRQGGSWLALSADAHSWSTRHFRSMGPHSPSRTTRCWVPRSRAPSPVAIDAVTTSPAWRYAGLRSWREKNTRHLSGVG